MIRKMLRALPLALRVFRESDDIESLLKLGNLFTDTASFDIYVERVMQDDRARELVELRYSPGLPSKEKLRGYPVGSLGHALYRHLHDHGLDLYPFPLKPSLTEGEYLRERQREIHDLLHTVLGCGIEVSEEATVNAFILGRAPAPISVLIVSGAMIQAMFRRPKTLPAVIQGAARGVTLGGAAPSPFGYRWEENLGSPLTEVRREFGLSVA